MKFAQYSLRFTAVLFCLVLTGCELPWKKKEATVQQKLVIVDVNDKDLHDAVHIKDALHVPFAELEMKAKDWNKADKYVVYCVDHRCTAAEQAADMLKKQGFENVRHLKGGIAAWHKIFSKDMPHLVIIDETKLVNFKPMLEAVEITDELKAAAEELKKEIEAALIPVAEEVKPVEAAPAAEVKPEVAAPAEQPAPAAPLADVK